MADSRRCFRCGDVGHIARHCPQKSPSLTCFLCGGSGHFKRDCPSKSSLSSSPRSGESLAVKSKICDLEDPKCCPEVSETVKNSPKAHSQSESPLHFTPFVDTHCHLEYVYEKYHHRGNFEAFMAVHSYPPSFEGCISTFCDPAAFSPSVGSWEGLLKESNVWGAFGIHPHHAKYYFTAGLEDRLVESLQHPKCVAFGEMGLDYAEHSPSEPQTQREVLMHQLALAISFEKPLVLHCRDAEEDLLQILSSRVPPDWRMQLHCYTGSLEMAERFLSIFPSLYIGVCGNVTFAKKHTVREVVCKVPLERMVLETDAPYNTPSNLPRARQCRFSHPALAFYVAKEVAKLRRVPVSDVLQAARSNTTLLYGV